MTDFPISVSAKRMGRPKLDVKPTLVRLREGAAERIDALIGKQRRSEFIRDAIEKELLRLERQARKPEPDKA